MTALIAPLYSHAAEDWLVAGKDTKISSNRPLALSIIKPAHADWPAALTVTLISAEGVGEEVQLMNDTESSADLNRRSYILVSSGQYTGIVHLGLKNLPSNQLLLQAAVTDQQEPVEVDSVAGTAQDREPASFAPTIVLAGPDDIPALSTHEPAYFIVGSSSERGADARFQISFKYRLFDPEGAIGKYSPLLSNLYFSYTQTSLWDLGADSSPFRDTSYRPGLFYSWQGSKQGSLPSEWRAGLEHESNGRSGVESRSINSFYLTPTWHMELPRGRQLSLSPRVNYFVNKKDNRDIQRYRGYVDWTARYGREDGLIISGLYRQGTSGYATGQLDLSYPISERIFARTGSFIHLQLFSGYGETLLDYNRHADTQIRLGISLAR